MVSIKCKACGHIYTTKGRMRKSCPKCNAKYDVVGAEIVKGKTEPKPEIKFPEPTGPKVVGSEPEGPAPLEIEPTPPPKPKPKPKPEPKVELYDCGTCGAKDVIKKGMKSCPACGVLLNWSDVRE